MAEDQKDVKTAPAESSTDVKVDHRGVPLENVVKEYQRKLEDATKRIGDLEARVVPAKAEEAGPSAEESAEERKMRLQEFVSDPDAYIERRLLQREFEREKPAAEAWLRSQKDFSNDDEVRILQIIKENQLFQPSPMLRAKAAFNLLQAEKLQREFVDQTRERSVMASMPEGAGRATPKKAGPSRGELIAQLAEAERSGHRGKALDILNLLEDVR